MKTLLKNLVKIKIIRIIDFTFSQFISQTNNIIMLIAACISFESNNGYICLSLDYFKKNNFFSIQNKNIIKKILFILNTKKINWSLEILNHHAFSNGNIITPLVFSQKKIYLYKIWKSEKNILQYLNQQQINNNFDLTKTQKLLQELFPNEEYNYQKIAVVLSMINQIVFILGGPGTGKTTIIIKIIIILIKNIKKNIKIQLAAPTGKAKSRLIEVLNNSQIFNLYLSLEEKTNFLLKPVTIHELLGISQVSEKIFFHKKNPLNIDVLIIDEVSMIDILMMNNILSAIQKNTKIIFIGDHNQLSPIGTGSVLKKIYNYSHYGYSYETQSILNKITQCSNIYNKENKNNTYLIGDKICVLTKNYRFQKNSGIYILSNAIYQNKKEIFSKLFNNLIKNVFFYEINCENQYKQMIDKIIFYNKEYWDNIEKKENIQKIIETFHSYQVLCVIRDGLFGINNINNILEQTMYKKNIIKKYFYINKKKWYIGKPIMITKNNKYFNLSNGDIGITYLNNKKKLHVYFLNNNNIKYIPVDLLENYETAWCITVHKSQGSEFNHTTLILPNKNLEILNKEILYTAITRSRKKLSIFSNKNIFIMTAKNTKTKNFN
ncbi:exodeoxyribonuclease V subunit alpha [Buchnera aphidicola (Aphis helianthi)]|uniref:RecBCD enzyme subunit RecD n=1 Tax=Buchnera aphidicola (Aphis helianthi) TaxID=2315802 RepID=A0A4D6XUI7_9GAMM|nr:exodeoxyribonuclease V subunit alpha [Buchnera aphidicola]QCI17261.1 exodeoxyribonuclease V subunit alpha [Buchnera aphidicola (Aphis helianthi)]